MISWNTKILVPPTGTATIDIPTNTWTLLPLSAAMLDEAAAFNPALPGYITTPSWATHCRITAHADWNRDAAPGETAANLRLHIFRNANLNLDGRGPTNEQYFHVAQLTYEGFNPPAWLAANNPITDRFAVMQEAETWSLFAFHTTSVTRKIDLRAATWLSCEFFQLPQDLAAEGDAAFNNDNWVTIACPEVTTQSLIRCTYTTRVGATINWQEDYAARVPGVSFAVKTGVGDANSFHWKVYQPAFYR